MQNRLRLHPAVFYRKYADKTVLYHTEQQRVYTFNASSGNIFDQFKAYCRVSDAIAALKLIYEVEDEEAFHCSISDFVNEMLEKGILKEEFNQREAVKTLEKEIGESFSVGGQLCSVLFELTYKCNEKCRHCYIADENRRELSTAQIKSILDELAAMNVMNVVFTGGEVFFRKDAFEILEYAYSKRFVIDIFTNGNLIDGNDYIRLKRIYPRSVQFSLYSHIPEKHDKITRVKGSFEKTLKSIQSCVTIGIPVNIKTPVFDETFEDVPEIIKLAKEIGVSIEIGSNITPKKDGNLEPTKMEISDIEKGKKLNEIIADIIPSEYNEQKKSLDYDCLKNCSAGDKSLSINPYGEVFPCNMLPLCIGDLTKQSIQNIWETSEKLKWWRANNYRKNRKGCEKCDLAAACAYCPGEAMIRTGNPLSKYDKACLTTFTSNGREIRKEEF